jgi:hypothetical protein
MAAGTVTGQKKVNFASLSLIDNLQMVSPNIFWGVK